MVDKTRNLTYRGIHTIKMAIERTLRGIFAADTMDARYRYSSVEKNTKIKIYRGFPKRLELFPTITISAGGFPIDLQAFGDNHAELMSEHTDADGLPVEVGGGMTKMPIKLKVFCKGSSDDRENVTDILIMIFRILNRSDFRHFGWVKGNTDGESQYIDIDKEIVFTNGLTIDTQADYIYQMLPQETDIFIEKAIANVIPVLSFTPPSPPPPPPPDVPVITIAPGQIYIGVPAIITGVNFTGTEVLIGNKLVPCTVDSPTMITFTPPELSEAGLTMGQPFTIQVNFAGYGLVSAPTTTQYTLPPPPPLVSTIEQTTPVNYSALHATTTVTIPGISVTADTQLLGVILSMQKLVGAAAAIIGAKWINPDYGSPQTLVNRAGDFSNMHTSMWCNETAFVFGPSYTGSLEITLAGTPDGETINILGAAVAIKDATVSPGAGGGLGSYAFIPPLEPNPESGAPYGPGGVLVIDMLTRRDDCTATPGEYQTLLADLTSTGDPDFRVFMSYRASLEFDPHFYLTSTSWATSVGSSEQSILLQFFAWPP